MRVSALIPIIFYCLLTACVKDKPNPDARIFPSTTDRGLFILNEGAYGNNNSEISFLNLKTQTMSNELFRQANGKSLGDVAQSVQYHEGVFYILLNNSNKLVMIDALTFKEIASIGNIPLPRYLQIKNQDKAYISSMTQAAVYVVDLKEKKIAKTILLDYVGSENMLLLNDYLWVCNWNISSPFIYKINTTTDEVESKIVLSGFASHDVVKDKNEMLWVLSGNKYQARNSYLTQLNPTTNEILKSYSFPSNQEPIRLNMNASRDTLYFINVDYDGLATDNGLYRMSILENKLPSAAFIPAQPNSYFWAYGIDSVTHEIYVADPKGFTQQSTILKYSSHGELMREFRAGIGANNFLFR